MNMNDETDNLSFPAQSPEAPMNQAIESRELLRGMAASTPGVAAGRKRLRHRRRRHSVPPAERVPSSPASEPVGAGQPRSTQVNPEKLISRFIRAIREIPGQSKIRLCHRFPTLVKLRQRL
jgi:hypothetical protein